MILSKTPLRISFFGGGTDFPEYFNQKQSYIIGTTINKFIYVSMMHKFDISFSDPLIKEYKLKESSKVLKSVKLTRKEIHENDLIVLLTDHDEFNYDLIFSNSRKIIDTRNKFPRDSKVISA